MQRATEHYRAGDFRAFHETLAVAAFRHSPASVSLCSPELPDCPLVGVSQAFEQLTGFSRSEIIGRSCRFLNYGCHIPASVRLKLRAATLAQRRFVGVLTNRRKSGEVFCNLLHLSALTVGGGTYVLGIQADVGKTDVDLQVKEQMDEINRIVDAIFAATMDAWAAMHCADFLGQPRQRRGAFLPYAEMQLLPSCWEHPFVFLTPTESLRCSNTFLEVFSEEGPGAGELLRTLRTAASEPALCSWGAQLLEKRRLPPQVLRDSLLQLRPGSFPLPGGEAGGRPLSAQPVGAGQLSEEEAEVDPSMQSNGSMHHPLGCTPCSFHCYSRIGCDRGQQCGYCHMSHPKRTRRRGKKSDRLRDTMRPARGRPTLTTTAARS